MDEAKTGKCSAEVRNHGLTEEQSTVLRSSPSLKPCKNFRKVTAARFVEHVNEGKCEQCVAFFRMLEKEQQMMQFLQQTLQVVAGGRGCGDL